MLSKCFICCSMYCPGLDFYLLQVQLYCSAGNYCKYFTVLHDHELFIWCHIECSPNQKCVNNSHLYIYVTMRHYDLFFNNQPDALIIQNLFCPKTLSCFGQLLCPSSRVLYCTFGTGKFHAGF